MVAVGGVGELQRRHQEIVSMSSTWNLGGGEWGCWLARGVVGVQTKKKEENREDNKDNMAFPFSEVNRTDEYRRENGIDEGEENRIYNRGL